MSSKSENGAVLATAGKIIGLILAQVLLFTPAWGMTIRHDRDDSLYTDLAAESQYLVSGKIMCGSSLGSGTLITPEWVLTAEHVVTGPLNFTVNGNTIAADTSSYAYHPDTDLALFRLVSPVNGLDYPPLFKPDMGAEPHQPAKHGGPGHAATAGFPHDHLV